jgi:hypothetical protein
MLADISAPYLERIETTRQEQRQCWRAEIHSHATVDLENYALDELVEQVSGALLLHIRQENPGWKESDARESAEYKLYFKSRPSDIVRLGLESELRVVRAFPERLAREESPALQAFAPRFAERVAAGDKAIQDRDRARAATAEHRARRILPLMEAINNLHSRVYRALLETSEQLRLPRSWAERFFYRPKIKSAQAETQISLPGDPEKKAR